MLTRRETFRYEEVVFHHNGVNLAGRLTFPSSVGSHPAIVMLHGSGAQNRYEFQPMAEYFASLGIVALTYDKRGVDHSSGQWQTATYEDLAEDALAGLRYLQSRSDINHKEIGMWGISQGGWLTLIAAVHSKDVAFIIPVSCPAVNPIKQELWRIEHILQAEGFPSEDIETAIELTKQGVGFWQGRNDGWDAFILSLEKVKEKNWSGYLGFEVNSTREEAQYEANRLIEPTVVLQQISCPILAIFGELDPFLPVDESARQFRETLAGNRHRDYEINVIPKGNHVLFNAITGSISEQPGLPGYTPDYLRIIRTWLLRHLRIDC